METELYVDASGEWRWRIIAGNGEIVGASTEGYRRREDCLSNHSLVTGYGVHPTFVTAVWLTVGWAMGVLTALLFSMVM
jgi:uncharacterized protein YegP (UPF0339 family)